MRWGSELRFGSPNSSSAKNTANRWSTPSGTGVRPNACAGIYCPAIRRARHSTMPGNDAWSCRCSFRPGGADRHQSPRTGPAGNSNGALELALLWTEVGARQVDIIQSILVTCRLYGLDVYPIWSTSCNASLSLRHKTPTVIELTPRLCKDKFAHAPVRADLEVVDE